MNRLSLLHVTLLLASPCLALRADNPPGESEFSIVAPKTAEGHVAVALNERGDLLGLEWVEEKPGVLAQSPFLLKAENGRKIRLPVAKGYTSTSPAALSESGQVVGRAMRPSITDKGDKVTLSNIAFYWDEATGIRTLPVLPDDILTTATGISADGTLITGISVGPNRVRPCVWTRSGEDWTPEPLPQNSAHVNTYVVAVSPNGKYVASIDGLKPTLWTRTDDRSWSRETIGNPGDLFPRAVNDQGTVVGFRVNADTEQSRDAVVRTLDGTLKTIARPDGYLYAELHAVNAAGLAVGFMDGPHGSRVSPRACVVAGDRLRTLSPDLTYTAANAVNHRNAIAVTVELDAAEFVEEEPRLEVPRPKNVIPK